MTGEMAASPDRGGSQTGRKVAGQMAGQLNIGKFLPIRPLFGHFRTLPFQGRQLCRRHFSAIFGSRLLSHSVAGQLGLNTRQMNHGHFNTKWI